MNAKLARAVGVLGLFLLLLAPELHAQDAIKAKLAKKVDTPAIDANTPLKDALEFLGDRHAITIVLDIKAFETAGIQKVEEQPVKLAAMKNTALGTVLENLAKQVEGTVTLQKDRVAIVPRKK